MKRRISICAAVFAVILLGAALYGYWNRAALPEDTQIAQAQPETEPAGDAVAVSTDNTAVFLYVLKDCDGRVAVYLDESGDLFMETGIRTADLPEQVRSRLTASEGIGFTSEESLFDFLESYSS